MLKIITTLFRSAQAEAEEALIDANAIRLLEQHLRDATRAFEVAKCELARVMADEKAQARAASELAARLAELEAEARAALDAGDDARAEVLAGRIAMLEDERTAHLDTREMLAKEAKRIHAQVDAAARRIAEVKRGLSASKAVDALQRTRGRLGEKGPGSGTALREAEAALRRVKERQQASEDVAEALDQVESTLPIAGAAREPSPRKTTDPKDVLARLKRAPPAGGAP
jgi:phage shock protein A